MIWNEILSPIPPDGKVANIILTAIELVNEIAIVPELIDVEKSFIAEYHLMTELLAIDVIILDKRLICLFAKGFRSGWLSRLTLLSLSCQMVASTITTWYNGFMRLINGKRGF